MLKHAPLLQVECPAFTVLSPGGGALSKQVDTLSSQPSTLNPQPSTLNPQPSTLNPQAQNVGIVYGRLRMGGNHCKMIFSFSNFLLKTNEVAHEWAINIIDIWAIKFHLGLYVWALYIDR